MQEFWQGLYPEEDELYSREEREILFSLDLSKFQNILSEGTWFKLQQEFETQENSLSQSYLIWTDGSGQQWMLADFGNKKTYYIDSLSDSEPQTGLKNAEGISVAYVSELPDLTEKLTDAQIICKLLRDPQTEKAPQGTPLGFIALIMKLDLGEVDLEELKRPGLSGSGLDFGSVHQDLVAVHGLFREILTSSGTSDTTLSDAAVRTVSRNLWQFYEIEEEIKDFDVIGEKPKERHTELLQKISNFYRNARSDLDPIIAYVRSTQMSKYQTEVKDVLDTATEKLKEFTAESGAKLLKLEGESEAKLQRLDELIIARENQIATTSISEHVTFFDNQAKEHRSSSWWWLGGTILMAVLFIVIVICSWFYMKPTGAGVTPILQNFFTKGFIISVFYMLLNRSIKNYAAEKHLEVVNLHRKNALATFDAFAEASKDDPHTRDQVLLASTNAIFDANQSGYLSTKTSRSDTANPILQIIKDFTPGKKE